MESWIVVLDWSHGVDSWSGTLECSKYVGTVYFMDLSHELEYWSGFLEWNLGMNIESEIALDYHVRTLR